MKITAVEVKPGMIIEHKNDYWNVLKAQHVKPGKGGAFNQVELKSIIKGTKLNERFRSSETVEKAELEEKKFNFLYLDDEKCHFMDNKTFEQISIPKSLIEEKYKFLKTNISRFAKQRRVYYRCNRCGNKRSDSSVFLQTSYA